MTGKRKTLIALGIFCGALFGALAGFWYACEGSSRQLGGITFLWSIAGAFIFGILSPLTNGRILSLLHPRVISGEYEQASITRWKYGFGNLFLVGLVAAAIAMGWDPFESLADWQIYLAFVFGIFVLGGLALLFRYLPFWLAATLGICGLTVGILTAIRNAIYS